ncbi:MAG: aminopeptidase P family protein [Thermoplasmata archaeon]|nr:aminopeptidase P family protein [Thermoplasmata archaeon]
MRERVRSIFRRLSPSPEALIVSNSEGPHIDTSFFYLFDVPSGSFEGSAIIARSDGSLTLLTSPLEAETARQAAAKDPSVEVQLCPRMEDQIRELRRLVDSKARVALNYRELTHEAFGALAEALPAATWLDASDAIQRTRRVKDASEIARIEKAGAIVSTVATEIPSLLRAGLTESQLAGELEYRMTQNGSAGRSFATIVGFGPHSAEPHFTPGKLGLKSGDSIVCDFGALYHRYISDLTRPFHFGPSDPEMRRVHATVAEAQSAALQLLRPGVRACDLHQAAQDVVDRSPWKGLFTHRLGHSIGLAVHDGFSLNPETTEPLETGETVTIEPGIYIPGKGGVRIEDDVVVTDHGYRFLTTASREYLGPDS